MITTSASDHTTCSTGKDGDSGIPQEGSASLRVSLRTPRHLGFVRSLRQNGSNPNTHDEPILGVIPGIEDIFQLLIMFLCQASEAKFPQSERKSIKISRNFNAPEENVTNPARSVLSHFFIHHYGPWPRYGPCSVIANRNTNSQRRA